DDTRAARACSAHSRASAANTASSTSTRGAGNQEAGIGPKHGGPAFRGDERTGDSLPLIPAQAGIQGRTRISREDGVFDAWWRESRSRESGQSTGSPLSAGTSGLETLSRSFPRISREDGVFDAWCRESRIHGSW